MRRRWQKAKPQKEIKFFKSNLQIKSEEVFLIDESGIITRIMLPKEVNTKIHASQILG